MHTLIRRVTFCAAHRLHSHNLSAQGNKEYYGKCNNIHGHNFLLEAMFVGDPNDKGMVVNMDEIDKVLQVIHDELDHTYINEDVHPFNANMGSVIPTCENLLWWMWQKITAIWDYNPSLKESARLHKLILHETPKNVFEYSSKEDNNE